MRQLKMVQDWGYNYIYLRHLGNTTQINLQDHSYRDVNRTPVEDFDSAMATESQIPAWLNSKAHLWIYGASECGSQVEEGERDRSFEDSDYIPDPFPEEMFEPLEWTQILATLDVCVNEVTPTKFCDKNGLDIVPICMINGIQRPQEEALNQTKEENLEKETNEVQCLRIKEEISVRDLDTIDLSTQQDESFELREDENAFHDVDNVLERLELDADDEQSNDSSEDDSKEVGEFFDFPNQKPRRQRYSKERCAKRNLRSNPMPKIEGKTAYLRLVGAYDCVKDKISGKFSQVSHQTKLQKKKEHKKRKERAKMNNKEPMWMKIERKKKYKELKKTLKEVWTIEMESEDKRDHVSVPSHYKKYTIQERRVIIEQPVRIRTEPGKSYDGPKDAKKIDLAEPGEESKPAYIATYLTLEERSY